MKKDVMYKLTANLGLNSYSRLVLMTEINWKIDVDNLSRGFFIDGQLVPPMWDGQGQEAINKDQSGVARFFRI